jgi:hypothetical protein
MCSIVREWPGGDRRLQGVSEIFGGWLLVNVPERLAAVVGPAMLAVEGDVTFENALTVPEAEAALSRMEAEDR